MNVFYSVCYTIQIFFDYCLKSEYTRIYKDRVVSQEQIRNFPCKETQLPFCLIWNARIRIRIYSEVKDRCEMWIYSPRAALTKTYI